MKITGTTTLAEGKFIRLELQSFQDDQGKNRKWEAAQRINAQAAVYIVARLRPSDKIVLVRQFRPPVNAFCIECPAGLVKPGESPAQTAIRELIEETGFHGKLISITPPAASSPGLTGELVSIAFLDIDETAEENQKPKQHLEANEAIQVFTIPRKELPDFLKQQHEKGDIIDSRLEILAALS